MGLALNADRARLAKSANSLDDFAMEKGSDDSKREHSLGPGVLPERAQKIVRKSVSWKPYANSFQQVDEDVGEGTDTGNTSDKEADCHVISDEKVGQPQDINGHADSQSAGRTSDASYNEFLQFIGVGVN